MNKSRIEANLQPVSGSRRQVATRPSPQLLHRLAAVMVQEGVTPRTMARRMKVPEAQVDIEADPRRDLRLSDLYRWQAALKVPVAELLVRPGSGLSEPIKIRAKLLKVMKTLRSIQQMTVNEATSRLAARLDSQLMDLMPELKEVAPWPSVGQRRTLEEFGAIVERTLPESFFGNTPTGGVND